MKLTLFLAFVLSIFGGHAAAADPKDPIVRLLKASQFAFGGVGMAGVTSEGEKAYAEIFARSTAETDFEKVFQSGSPAAKAYALTAIHQLNPAKFTELSAAFRKQNISIPTMTGCIMGHSNSSAIVDEIASGIHSTKK